MNIEILNVAITSQGKYQVAEVAFKNLSQGGKVETKKIMSFINKDVFATVSDAKTGQQFSVVSEKNDKGYWEWKSISAGLAESAPANKPYSPPAARDFEGAAERKEKQRLIVKQSSLASAITLLGTNTKTAPSVPEVLAVADSFVQWVFSEATQPHEHGEDPTVQ